MRDGVAAIQQVIVDTGALAELEVDDRAARRRGAWTRCNRIVLDAPATAELEALAHYVVGRPG